MLDVQFEKVCLSEYQPASHEIPVMKLDFDIRSECEVKVTTTMTVRKKPNASAENTSGAITLNGSKEHINLKGIKINGNGRTR